MAESRAEIAERELKQMAESREKETKEKEKEEIKPINRIKGGAQGLFGGVFGKLFGGGSEREKTVPQDIPVSEPEQIMKLMVTLIKYYNATLSKNQADDITRNIQSVLTIMVLHQPADSPTFRKGYIPAFNAFIKGISGSMRSNSSVFPYTVPVNFQFPSSYEVKTEYKERQKKEWNELADLFDKVGISDAANVSKGIFDRGFFEVIRDNRDLIGFGLNMFEQKKS